MAAERYGRLMTGAGGQAIELKANGMTFSGLEWGPPDGRTVLLLHGFPQRASSWAAVAGRLAAAGLRAVAVDQRGYSPGARPDEVADYALANLVADAAGVIDALGGPVDLVGHDWGAVVGWRVAAQHPDRVRTWTAVSTPNPTALNEVLAVDEEQRNRFGYILVFREPGRAESALLGNEAAGLRAVYGSAIAAERVEDDVAFFSQEGVLTKALNWYRAMSVDDAVAPPRVSVPTTYVWGSADLAFGRAAAEKTADFVDADYRFVPIEGASHWLPDEKPDQLADEVVRRILG